jgi:pteridine reductase
LQREVPVASPDAVRLRDKVALVTGAGRRVGRALAIALGRHGAKVGVHFNGSEKGAAETAQLIASNGGTAATFGADLTRGDAPSRLVDAVVGKFGGLDILVNSAAVMIRTPFDEIDVRQWDEIFALNLRAPFFLSKAAAPALRRRNGIIVNIADLAAFETWPGYIPHGLTKSGIVHMTRALARVLAPDVRVNAIAPGTVLLPDGWTEDDEARLNETTPLRRPGSPDDVADAMLFLIGASYVTGETIIVDGGRHVRR